MTILVAAGSGCRSTAGVAPLPASIEQTTKGTATPAVLVEAFDGLGDDMIEKHACVADRVRMLRGEASTEQCVVISDVNFLNNVDLDGTALRPAGAPNIMLAAGGSLRQHRHWLLVRQRA